VATLYRPKVTTYRLPGGAYRTPAGKRVTKDTPGAVRDESRSKTWWGRYTDAAGKEHQVKLSMSKEIARRMLAKLAGDAQLARVGLADPYAGHRERPLLEHLEDFARALATRNNTAAHVKKAAGLARIVVEGCGFRGFEDVEPGAVAEFLAGLRRGDGRPPLELPQEWYTAREAAPLIGFDLAYLRHLAKRGPWPGPAPRRQPGKPVQLHRDSLLALYERRGRGIGVRTSNDYLRSATQFTRWLARERRAPFDPLAHLSRLNPDADARHPRRTLGADDFACFVEATGGGTKYRGLSGRDRLVIYCLSARTGLRAGELASLTPASFDLDADPPTVTVQAAFSKHRRKDVLPLRKDVAELLRGAVAGRPRHARLWPGRWHEDGAAILCRDLEAAGIPYEDEEGRAFDFHALRHTFLTHLAESRVHPKVAQVLARHSSIHPHTRPLHAPGGRGRGRRPRQAARPAARRG
jgi:integrase